MTSGWCLGLVGHPERTGGSRETGQFPGTGCETLGAPRVGGALLLGLWRAPQKGPRRTRRHRQGAAPWYRGGSSVKPGSRNGGAAGAFGVLKEMWQKEAAKIAQAFGREAGERLPSLVEVGQGGRPPPSILQNPAQTSPFPRTFIAPSQGWRRLSLCLAPRPRFVQRSSAGL